MSMTRLHLAHGKQRQPKIEPFQMCSQFQHFVSHFRTFSQFGCKGKGKPIDAGRNDFDDNLFLRQISCDHIEH